MATDLIRVHGKCDLEICPARVFEPTVIVASWSMPPPHTVPRRSQVVGMRRVCKCCGVGRRRMPIRAYGGTRTLCTIARRQANGRDRHSIACSRLPACQSLEEGARLKVSMTRGIYFHRVLTRLLSIALALHAIHA